MIPAYSDPLPFLTTDQMREVDRLMIEVYHIELIQMMENAGRSLAQLARERFLDGDPRNKRVVVLAGMGGNGGGALVAARWLHNAGADVQVYLTAGSDRFAPVSAHQLDILNRLAVPVAQADRISEETAPALVVDGIIGYSLQGPPRANAANLITWAVDAGAPVLSLDVPSGLDATTGSVFAPAISATATMTLALPKEGLRALGAEPFVGELYLASIGVPRELYAEPSLRLKVGHIFAHSDIVWLR
jgi:NAD(P)H-hydrate epimerase